MSVKDVIVMETAASLNVSAILSGTGLEILVLLQAANMTKVSSIPIPIIEKHGLHLAIAIFHKVITNVISSKDNFFPLVFLLLVFSAVRILFYCSITQP